MPRPTYAVVRTDADGTWQLDFASLSSRALAEIIVRRCRACAKPGVTYDLREDWDGQSIILTVADAA